MRRAAVPPNASYRALLAAAFATDQPLEAVIDGDLHTTSRECCRIMGKACRKCGGFVHGQPVYGGIADLCETCEPDAWWPAGSHREHDDGYGWSERLW